MASKGYTTAKKSTTRYEYVSIGPKGQITKRIEFTALRKRGYYNVAFGDIMKDGRIDDKIYSNNQDIVKIMATVIDTMKDFLRGNPSAKLVFSGSTENRTRFYRHILTRHYPILSTQYTITTLAEDKNGNIEESAFDPTEEKNYLAFLVRNKL